MVTHTDIPITTATDLGAIIRERRKHLALDQRSLAERADVSRQWIVEIERGKPRAEISPLLLTLQALGLRLVVADQDAAAPAPSSAAVAVGDVGEIMARARGLTR